MIWYRGFQKRVWAMWYGCRSQHAVKILQVPCKKGIWSHTLATRTWLKQWHFTSLYLDTMVKHFPILFLLTWQYMKALMPVLSTGFLTLNSKRGISQLFFCPNLFKKTACSLGVLPWSLAFQHQLDRKHGSWISSFLCPLARSMPAWSLSD